MSMYDLIYQFPDHCQSAWTSTQQFLSTVQLINRPFTSVIVSGLGGSAIGGDVLKGLVASTAKVPVIVNRHYQLPNWVGKDALFIASSYSGNTEETLAAYQDAKKRGSPIIGVSSGGTLTEWCKKDGFPCVPVTGGLPPRAAFGYSFFTLLSVAAKLDLLPNPENDVETTIANLKSSREIWKSETSQPGAFAAEFFGYLPIIYSSCEELEPVNVRWRGQIEENAKQLAYGNVFPELNHNEIVGWEINPDLYKKFKVLILKSPADYSRVKLRMDITSGIIKSAGGDVQSVEFSGGSSLERMILAIHFGDWLSWHLSVLNKADAMPVHKIDTLKNELAKHP